MNPLFIKGNKTELEQEDLYAAPVNEKAENVYHLFESSWTENVAANKVGSVKDALKRVLGFSLFSSGLLRFFNTTIQFTWPVLFNLVLVSLKQLSLPQSQRMFYDEYAPLYLALGLCLAMLLKAMSENMYFHTTFRMARQANAALTSAVYRKSLRLAPASRQNFTVGEIVNLMQLDSNRLGNEFIPQMHSLWDGLYQIVGYSAQAIYYLGPSALVGIVVMIIAIPAQFYFMMKLMKERQGMVKDTDKRIKQMNEILQGIKVVKLYNWEKSFIESIEKSRANEMDRLKRVSSLRAANGAIMMATPAAVATAAFLTYSASGAPFLASTLFTVIMIYGQLRFPLMMYPQMGAALQNARLSASRLERFLNAPEIDENAKKESVHVDDPSIVVSIQKGSFYWTTPEDAKKINDEKLIAANEKLSKLKTQIEAIKTPKKKVVVVDAKSAEKVAQLEKESGTIGESVKKLSTWEPPKPVLENIDLEVKKGQLVAIIGSVGSGKSSLLSAILGDLFKVSGKVQVNGKVAYVSQTAWIVNATAKENIVFGKTHHDDKYDDVIKCCQLQSDFEILPNGSSTEIGEKGINLSGGQKQRISIARAVYDDADIYVFDDPLSALDTEVGSKIFTECISEALKDKTRILVTNQLQYLSACDIIYVIKDGIISESGTYEELMSKGLNFSGMMKSFGHDESKPNVSPSKASKKVPASNEAITKPKAQDAKLIEAEEKEKGVVKTQVYSKWIGASRAIYLFVFVIFMYLLLNVATVGQQLWIVIWTGAIDSNNRYMWGSSLFFMLIYAGMAFLMALSSYFRVYALAIMGIKSSQNMHNTLLHNVLRAPMSFFDTTPIGRIITRFSKDIDSIDMELPDSFGMVMMCLFNIAFSLGVIIYTTPWFAVAVLPIAIFYYITMNYFRNVSRSVKRLEPLSRSPIFAHFSETLGGLPTIRAYHYSDKFITHNTNLINANMSAVYIQKVADRWLALRLEMLADVIYFIAAVLAFFSVKNGAISSSLAGLSLSFAGGVTSLLSWVVRSFAELEAKMNSVERIIHYSENIAQEGPFTSSKPPESSWPKSGNIVLKVWICARTTSVVCMYIYLYSVYAFIT